MPISTSNPVPPKSIITKISSETLTGAAANFTQVTIPSGFEVIRVTLYWKNAGAGANFANIRFNSDAGANYSYQVMNGVAAIAGAGAASGLTSSLVSGCQLTNQINTTTIIINNGNTFYKSFSSCGGTGGRVDAYGGNWNCNDLINSIYIFFDGGNADTGSRLIIEGWDY